MSIADGAPAPAPVTGDENTVRHNGDSATSTARATPRQSVPRTAAPVSPGFSPKLGEELPVFCERCGYQLFGLTPQRCDRCDILQFHCPECAHHQPINTLRPAAQRIIGRLRGAWLTVMVLFKLNFFFWALFAFGGVSPELSYGIDEEVWRAQALQNQQQQAQYQAQLTAYNAAIAAAQANPLPTQPAQMPVPPTPPVWTQPTRGPRPLHTPERVALSIMGVLFGMFGRMMLLRWRRGAAVGAVLAGLVAAAIVCGIAIYRANENQWVPWPWRAVLPGIFVWSCGTVLLGAVIVWPIWATLVRAFLPTRTGNALLEWQRSLSNRVSALARDPVGA